MNVLIPQRFVYSVHPLVGQYNLLVIDKTKTRGRLNACSHIRRVLIGSHVGCMPVCRTRTLARFEEAMDVLWECGVRPSDFLLYDANYFNTSDRPEDKAFANKWNEREATIVSLKLVCVHAIRSSLIPVTEQRLEQLTMIPKALRTMINFSDGSL